MHRGPRNQHENNENVNSCYFKSRYFNVTPPLCPNMLLKWVTGRNCVYMWNTRGNAKALIGCWGAEFLLSQELSSNHCFSKALCVSSLSVFTYCTQRICNVSVQGKVKTLGACILGKISRGHGTIIRGMWFLFAAGGRPGKSRAPIRLNRPWNNFEMFQK